MARELSEITEAEIEAAADVMLTRVAAPDPGPTNKWRALQDADIIAHEEVGDLVARMIRAAELARESA